MSRTSNIPAEISKYRPCKSSRIRYDSDGTYRVYKYKAKKLASGRWASDSGYLIGKIIPEEGFIPNKRYMKELEEQGIITYSDGITEPSASM
jgi:hypothetical protein